MKKLLMGAMALTIFALSIMQFETSCSKTNAQQRPTNTSRTAQLDKIIYLQSANNTNGAEIWTANSDGTSQTQVPIVLPTGMIINNDMTAMSVKVSPDGQTIFFSAWEEQI